MQEIFSLKMEKVRTQTCTAGKSGPDRNIVYICSWVLDIHHNLQNL